MSDGSVVYDIVADDSKFKATIGSLGASIEREMGRAGQSMQAVGKGISKYVTAPMVAMGVVAGKKTVEFVKLYESAQVVFSEMLGGAEAAKKLTNELVEMSKASTFSRETLIAGGKALIASGAGSKEATRWMQALTNANSLYGGSAQDLTDKADMVSRVLNKGKFTMMEINSLQQAGIPVMAILANQYKVTRDEMQDMISKGLVPATEGLDLLTAGMEAGTDGAAGMTVAMEGMAASLKGGTLTGALDSTRSAIRTFSLELLGMNPQLEASEAGFLENQKALGQVIAAISTLNGIISASSAIFKPFTDLWYRFLDWLVGVNGALDDAGKWVMDLENVGGALGQIRDFLDTADPERLAGIGRGLMGLAAAGPGLVVVGKAVSSLGKVIGPAVAGLDGLAKGGGKLAPMFAGILKALPWVGGVAGLLVAGFLEAKTGIISGFIDQIPGLLQGMVGMVRDVLTALPGVIADSLAGLGAIVTSLVGIIPDLLIAIADLVIAIVESLPALIPVLVDGFVDLLMTIVNAVAEVIPPLLEAIPLIIIAVLDLLPTLIPALLNGSFDLLLAIVQAVPVILPLLLDAVVKLIIAVVKMLPSLLTAIINAAIALFTGIITAVPRLLTGLWAAIKDLITAVIRAFPSLVSQFEGVGGDLIRGIVSGVKNGVRALVDAVKNAARRALDAAKAALGINSPSRVFRDVVGAGLMEGWDDGISRSTAGLVRRVKNTASAIVDAAATPNLYASLAAAPAGGYALAGMTPSVPSGRYGNASGSTTIYQIGDVQIPGNDPLAQQTFADLGRLMRRYSRMGPTGGM